jgi:D-alanine-D-alanine ligase
MRIGYTFDLRNAANVKPGQPDDINEEYDSADTVELIENSLSSLGHQVIRLDGGLEFLKNACNGIDVDFVFNISEGLGNSPSREAQVPSILEVLNVPYSGSAPQCLSICLDKPLTKHILKAHGIITPQWRLLRTTQDLDDTQWQDIIFPVVVKPAHEGSSIGIGSNSLALSPMEAQELTIKLLDSYNQPVMIEQYIAGKEITVGIIGFKTPQVLGIMEAKPKYSSPFFMYSIDVKRDYLKLVDYECPADLTQDTLENINDISLKIFAILGCRDMARLDFRVDKDGIPYFIEINPLPGLGSHSDLVIMADLLGISHVRLIEMILSASLERYPQCDQV